MVDIAVFVDVQNIYYTTREIFGRSLDYRKLWKKVSAQGDIRIANAYAIESEHEGQNRFQKALYNIGFNVKLKPFIKRRDGSAKGDWDVGITIDVLDAARNIKTIILMSGDGDFELLIRKIKGSYGVSTEVYGVKKLTSQTLINATDKFIAIEDDLLI